MVGKADFKAMVCTPEPAMLKAIVSSPACWLALKMAWRSEQAPLSLTLVTKKVDSNIRSSSASKPGRAAEGRRDETRRTGFCNRRDMRLRNDMTAPWVWGQAGNLSEAGGAAPPA